MVLKHSAFVDKKPFSDSIKEVRMSIFLAVSLVLTGALFLFVPFMNLKGLFILLASWVMIATIALTIARPLKYCRGFTDISTALLADVFFLIVELSLGYSPQNIQNYRFILCFTLFMLGISRIIEYSQIMAKVRLPMLIVCGAYEVFAAIIIFSEFPVGGYTSIYFLIGVSIILSGFENIQEAGRLRSII